MKSKEIILNDQASRQSVTTAIPLAKMLAVGEFSSSQIAVIPSDAKLTLDPEVSQRADEWRQKLTLNELRVRLVGYDIESRIVAGLKEQHLVLTCGAIDYATYRATNDFKTFRRLGFAGSSAALTIDMAVVTEDGFLIASTKKKGEARGSNGVPGGGVKVELNSSGFPHPIDLIEQGLREVREELGLGELCNDAFSDSRVLGLGFQYGESCHPFVAGYTHVALTRAEVMKYWDNNNDGEIKPLPVDISHGVKGLQDIFKNRKLVEPDEAATAILGAHYALGRAIRPIVLRREDAI